MRHYERRDFLKHAGMGLTVTAFGLPRSFAQANREMVNVRTLGATGDGKTLDTPAINKAIETIAGSGGGTLFFPAGNYLCYSIRLKSNTAFYLDQVEGADFYRIRTPRVAGVPEFVLNKVSDFSVHDCNGVADTHMDQTEHQAIG